MKLTKHDVGVSPSLPTKEEERAGERSLSCWSSPLLLSSPHSFLAGRGRKPGVVALLNFNSSYAVERRVFPIDSIATGVGACFSPMISYALRHESHFHRPAASTPENGGRK